MTIYAAKQFAQSQALNDWGCYADRNDRDAACLERGFEAGIECFRKEMKDRIEKMFANDLILRLGKTDLLKNLDVEFETKT